MPLHYHGNGPYCIANSLRTLFGPTGPEPGVIEVLTGSPFGFALHGDDLPFFSPPRWNPEIGIQAALDLLGWTCEKTSGSRDEARERLLGASVTEPVLAGPIEMGLLPHIPGLGHAIGAEHYLLVIGVEDDTVVMHDPQGYPYATLPLDVFLNAYQTHEFVYEVAPFITRSRFRRVREVDVETALRRSLPAAVKWLDPADSAAAAEKLAGIVARGVTNNQYKFLVEYTVQGGARRLADAAALLQELRVAGAGAVMERQARLVGSLQHPLTVHDGARAAAILRELAPTYEQLQQELLNSGVS